MSLIAELHRRLTDAVHQVQLPLEHLLGGDRRAAGVGLDAEIPALVVHGLIEVGEGVRLDWLLGVVRRVVENAEGIPQGGHDTDSGLPVLLEVLAVV